MLNICKDFGLKEKGKGRGKERKNGKKKIWGGIGTKKWGRNISFQIKRKEKI